MSRNPEDHARSVDAATPKSAAPEEDADFVRLMDDLQVIYGAKAGHVLTQDDVDALNRLDKHYRDNEEDAVQAFHDGRLAGIAEAGSTNLSAQIVKAERLKAELWASKGIQKFAYADRDRAIKVLRKLTMCARMSGGVAGPDADLMAACSEAEALFADKHGAEQ